MWLGGKLPLPASEPADDALDRRDIKVSQSCETFIGFRRICLIAARMCALATRHDGIRKSRPATQVCVTGPCLVRH
jgi:hypothetical protein